VDKDMALTGDISKAKKVLNWQPKTDFNGLIDIMITEGEKEIK
jgi:GDP-D-mannose dehydratase